MTPEFEEKQFEFPLAVQLLSGGLPLYAPGQVLEAQLGHDFAVQTINAAFWALWGMLPPAGAVPTAAWWPTAQNPPPVPLPQLPPFSLNLFVQAKRAERMVGSKAKQWGHWHQPYYRFAIDTDQQDALVACANGIGQAGKVVYAAPAFWQLNDLFGHVTGRSLVTATNFVEAVALGNHTVYTFVGPGVAGAAFSRPERIPPFRIPADLSAGTRDATRGLDLFRRAHDAVQSASKMHPWFRELRPRWLALTEEAVARVAESRADSEGIALSFTRVWTYAQLVGLGWLIAGA